MMKKKQKSDNTTDKDSQVEEDKKPESKPKKTKSPPPLKEPTIEEQAAQYKAGWQRALADYKNLENQVAAQRIEFAKFAKEGLIEALLPTLDYFDTAMKHLPDISTASEEAQKTHNNWLIGIQQVQKLLLEVLKNEGVEQVPESGTFDPNLHEAVEERDEGEGEPGTILETNSKGYTLHGKLIRPAKVIIKK